MCSRSHSGLKVSGLKSSGLKVCSVLRKSGIYVLYSGQSQMDLFKKS